MSATTAPAIKRPRKRKPPTPRVYVRSDNTIGYQIRYRIERDCKLVEASQMFDTPEAAGRFANLLVTIGPEAAERVLAAQLKVAASKTITIGEYLRQRVATLTGIEKATGRKYLRYIANDIDGFLVDGETPMGSLPLDAYDEDLDAAWVMYLQFEACNKPGRKPGNSPKTIRNKHGFVSEAMAAAARRRPNPLVPYNPCAYTRLPKVYPKELDYFTSTEFELFEALLTPQWRALFEFAVMSMCRPGEIFALTVGDVDPETGAVRITKAWKYDDGRLLLGPPKSPRAVRTVYVPLETIARLDLDRPADELLFTTGRGTPLTVPDVAKRMWSPALRRLEALTRGGKNPNGVNLFGGSAHWEGETPAQLLARFGLDVVEKLLAKTITPYTSRHTGISWRLQDGTPIWVVSRDAGHESQATTDKRYGHMDSRASVAAAQTAAGRLPGLRRHAVDLDLARRRREVRAGRLGEICAVGDEFEAVWMSDEGRVESLVFDTYEAAVDHVARHEAGDPIETGDPLAA
ncbi:tyrosine-type recombinase/integrase [Nocardia brasiliensis]|uniref:tyrosine-type recombinase/integrase n=1 Tax=Nocardia brasiliensis TaxID=37326 RepID=UPI0034063CFB